jgi:hypothetical protein
VTELAETTATYRKEIWKMSRAFHFCLSKLNDNSVEKFRHIRTPNNLPLNRTVFPGFRTILVKFRTVFRAVRENLIVPSIARAYHFVTPVVTALDSVAETAFQGAANAAVSCDLKLANQTQRRPHLHSGYGHAPYQISHISQISKLDVIMRDRICEILRGYSIN